jgi:hypothetical protein
VTVSFLRRTLLHDISYFSRFRPPRKHTASQLQRSVGLCLEGTSEHCNEPSGSIKAESLTAELSYYQIFENDHVPWSWLYIRGFMSGCSGGHASICVMNFVSILTAWPQDRRMRLYEGHLKSSWTHLITPSRNFVEVR